MAELVQMYRLQVVLELQQLFEFTVALNQWYIPSSQSYGHGSTLVVMWSVWLLGSPPTFMTAGVLQLSPPAYVPSISALLASCTPLWPFLLTAIAEPSTLSLALCKSTAGHTRLSSQHHMQYFPCKTWGRRPHMARSCLTKGYTGHAPSEVGGRRYQRVSLGDGMQGREFLK